MKSKLFAFAALAAFFLVIFAGWLVSKNTFNSASPGLVAGQPAPEEIKKQKWVSIPQKQDFSDVSQVSETEKRVGERVVLPKQAPVEELIEKAERETPRGVFRFAEAVPVKFSPENAGKWEQAGNLKRWTFSIQSPEASSLNLGFSKFVMPAGGEMRIFAPENADEPVYRPFTENDNDDHGQLWTPIVAGDEVIVEATVPAEKAGELELEVAQVSHGFRGLRPKAAKIGGGTSGSCNIDVVCDDTTLPGGVGAYIDAMRDQIRSVGAYTLNGTDTCSGALVNNAQEDRTPYFLTAEHCGITVANAPSVVVYWNFENSTCRTPGSAASGQAGDGDLSEFNTGAIFRAADVTSDFCLVELDDDPDPEFNLHFAGWNYGTDDPTMGTAIHHPGVAEKRISFELDTMTTTPKESAVVTPGAAYIRVEDWDHGSTDGGSSGSPLFDENGRIVGQLFGGDADCGNDLSDWYGRLSTSWTGGGTSATSLSSWLDPAGDDPLSLGGLNQENIISISDVSISEGDSGTTNATLTITLDRRNDEVVQVNWLTVEDTATVADGDFSIQGQNLTFTALETSKIINVLVNGDTDQELDEEVKVILSNPTEAIIVDTEGVITIQNDDNYPPPVITSPATANGDQDRLFTYQVTASNFPDSFSLINSPPAGMTIDGNGLVSWTPDGFGTFTFDVRATSLSGSGDQTVTLTVAENVLGDALDNTTEVFSTSGEQPFFRQSAVTSDGVDALQSGPITHNQQSVLEFPVTGPDTLIFDWKVSSESQWDNLQLLREGVVIEEISGEVDWHRMVVDIPAGNSTMRFRYLKDGSVDDGADAGYIDQLFLSSTTDRPVITSAIEDQAITGFAYSYQIETQNPATSFTATGLPTGLNIDTNSGLISGTPSVSGTFPIDLTASDATYTEIATLVLEISTPIPGMQSAVGSDLSWSTSGDADWFIQNAVSRDGQAVQSGAIGNDESSSLFTIVNGPADFRFFWKVDSEFFDKLLLFVDGEEVDFIRGDVDWVEKNVILDSGNHVLEFRYEKDVTGSSGADAAYLDTVEVIPLPTPITGVSATDGAHENFVLVSWDSSAQPVDLYRVYRADVDDFSLATEIGTTAGTSIGDASALRGQIYYYFVKGENSAGQSGESPGDSGYANPDPPTAVKNLDASDGDFDDRVEITWTAATGVDEYRIYKSTDPGLLGSLLATVQNDVFAYTDTAVTPETAYYYTVAAFNLAGENANPPTDMGSRKFDPPTGLTATTDDPDGVDLAWTSPAGTPASFRIYRSAIGDFSDTILAGEVAGDTTTFTDTVLNPGFPYRYRVVAVGDLTGESDPSNEIDGVRLFIDPVGIVQPGTPSAGPGATNALYDAAQKGTYTGLIFDTLAPGTDVKLYGKAVVKVAHNTKTGIGSASITLIYENVKYALKSALNASGAATIAFNKKDDNATPMSLTVQILDSDNGLKMAGSLTGDGNSGTLDLYKLVYHKTKNPSPLKGRFTIILPHDEAGDASVVPGGDGAGSASIGIDGRVRLAGVLGEGTKFSVSTYLSSDSETSVYQKLYKGDSTGFIGGLLRFADVDNVSSADGILQWLKGADAAQGRYPDGFDLQQGAVISRYQAPNTKAQEFAISDLRDGNGNALFYLQGGNLSYNIGSLITTWSRKNRIKQDSRFAKEVLKPKVNIKTGIVNGTYVDKANGINSKFYGAIFQEQDRVTGHLVGSGETGYFQIKPNGTPQLDVTLAVTEAAVTNGDSFDFGDTGHEGGFGEIGFFIENNGDGTLHLRDVPTFDTATPEDFVITFATSGFIKPGERTLIRARFQPQSSGAKTATLRVLTNDETDNPFEILFTGNAIAGNSGLGRETLPGSAADSPMDVIELTESTAANYNVSQNGSFRGLIVKNEAGSPVSGIAAFKLSTNKKTGLSAFSGSVAVDKKRVIKGTILADGSLDGDFTGSSAANWTPAIQVQETVGGSVQIVGLLTNEETGDTYSFVAVPNRFHKTNNPAPMSGRYTAVLPATSDFYELYPGGHGYSSFGVSTAGTAKISLVLGNFGKATLSGFVSEDGQLQVFTRALNGILTFRDVPGVSDVDGELNWKVNANSKASRYSRGFEGKVNFVGSVYDPAPANGWLLPQLEAAAGGNVNLQIEGLDLSATLPIAWAQNNKVVYTPISSERVLFRPVSKTGLISGYWWDRPNSEARKTFRGVILQKQDGVFGTIINGLTTGRIEIAN